MFRDISLIFFACRVLLFLFFLILSMDKPSTHKALVIVPSVIYLSLATYVFIYPGSLKIFRNYGDLIFIPTLSFLSGQKEALFTLLPAMAIYTSRSVFIGMLFMWSSVALSFYYYQKDGILLLPLLTATFLASLHPDLVEALRKERFYIRKLRKAYTDLLSDYGRLEKRLSTIQDTEAILNALKNCGSLEDYLKALKEQFRLKSISISPKRNGVYKDTIIDMANCSFHVLVKLEKGNVYVSFYLNNPLELYDKELLKNLEKAGKLINLFIESVEEKPQTKVIAI